MPHNEESKSVVDIATVGRELSQIARRIHRRRFPEATQEEKERIAYLQEQLRLYRRGRQG